MFLGRPIVVTVVTIGELRERVVVLYDRLGMPSWPDPRPGTDRAGARVCAEVLGNQPGVEVEALAPAPLDDEVCLGWFDRGVRLASPWPGTVPLLLLERDARPDMGSAAAVDAHGGVARKP